MLHVYNINKHEWMAPVHIDSDEGSKVYIRRRAPYLGSSCADDIQDSKLSATRLGPVWKQTFKEENVENELIDWSAPKVLTLQKMKKIGMRWRLFAESKARNKQCGLIPDSSFILPAFKAQKKSCA